MTQPEEPKNYVTNQPYPEGHPAHGAAQPAKNSAAPKVMLALIVVAAVAVAWWLIGGSGTPDYKVTTVKGDHVTVSSGDIGSDSDVRDVVEAVGKGQGYPGRLTVTIYCPAGIPAIGVGTYTDGKVTGGKLDGSC